MRLPPLPFAPRAVCGVPFAALATLLLPLRPLTAQTVTAGARSASVTARVGLVIPVRLLFRDAGAPRLLHERGDTARYAMELEVAANLAWRLLVSREDFNSDGRSLTVKDHEGVWHDLAAGTVTVAADERPTHWRRIRLEVDVVSPRGPRTPPALVLKLAPSQR